jgi:inner membrane protein
MKGTTHLAAGLACAALISNASVYSIVGITVGSLLPDIDSPTSILGRNIPILPHLVKHRGLTHSLAFVVAMYLICPPLAIGCVLHIILDMLNPAGVSLLWPIPWKAKLPLVKFQSGGTFDKILGSLLWLLVVILYGKILI